MPPDVTLGGGGTAFVLAGLDSRELVEAACLKDDELDDENDRLLMFPLT